ncbi:unnamed protein product [Prorocentrum cordatum]|uniref:PROP1-like PPR domain-containing protein n=1 Tax=Prorocentrum cordatum TaxID=2364126 RepID=A0ABN9T1X3_9DINO|nr:unnamed protein product [Polarella glacialis]
MLSIKRGYLEGAASFEVRLKKCDREKQWKASLQLLHEAIQSRVELIPRHYVVIISICRRCGQWQRALSLFREMCESKVEQNVIITYSAAISACEKGEQWQRALALLSEMWEAKVEPNVFLQRWDQRVREGLSVAAGAGAAERDPGGETGAPPPVSYNAGISACEKREQWQRSLALLSEMCEAKLEPDIISYTAGISACEKGLSVAAGAGAAERDGEGEAGAQRHQLQRWGKLLREGRAVAASTVTAQQDRGGRAGAPSKLVQIVDVVSLSQLQRWDQRVREGLSVAAGAGAAERDV